jgi:hypothetical protein
LRADPRCGLATTMIDTQLDRLGPGIRHGTISPLHVERLHTPARAAATPEVGHDKHDAFLPAVVLQRRAVIYVRQSTHLSSAGPSAARCSSSGLLDQAVPAMCVV